MAVQCPYCRHALSLKKAKPGRYAPTCPECGRRFQLVLAGPEMANFRRFMDRRLRNVNLVTLGSISDAATRG